ncbi:MAG: acyl carrier protein [Gemmatimonadetes bacterium]|nr:MAG: acyl carrier protein [Gemmatimonadota bacterium]
MSKEEIKKLVLDIVEDIVPDEDLSNIDPDVRLREQMDLDSMDFLDIVMELRKRYKIEVPEDDYMELATLNSSAEYLYDKLKDVPYEGDR